MRVSPLPSRVRFPVPIVATALLMSCLARPTSGPMGSGAAGATTGAPATKAPNVLIIVADDMGFSDIGVLGSEIATPNIDRLAESGTLFTRFYTSPTCSPTRAMLLTGVDNHLVGLGNMEETLDPAHAGQQGYEGHLNDDAVTMAEIFRDAGYQTYMAGKWHLGMEHDQSPHARGFERTFALLGGGAGHFADGVGQDVYRTEPFYRRDGELVDALPNDFYSTDFFTDSLIAAIEEGDPERPYLAYLAYTAPHWPLQAPPAKIEAQRGAYAAGYDVVRSERFAALQDAGLVPRAATVPPGGAPPWESLPEDERTRSQRTMEVYAAMVEHMDASIGRLLQTLEERGESDNTVVFFMSDNGADGLEFHALNPAFAAWADSFDNSLENIGHPNSFVAYGRGWAHAGEAPHAGFKGLMTEGGVRSPLVVWAPPWLRGDAPQAARYTHPVTVRDILPTLLDYGAIQGSGHRLSGASLRPALVQRGAPVHADQPLVMELWGRKAVILDEWKLVQQPPPAGDGEWHLFHGAEDVSESTDLAGEHPERVARMIAAYESYADANRVIPPTQPLRLNPPASPAPER